MVDVADEVIESAHALLQAARQQRPLLAVQHTRDDVEGDKSLGVTAVGINGKGDADAAEQQLGLPTLRRQSYGRRLVDPATDELIARLAILTGRHFVEGGRRAPRFRCRWAYHAFPRLHSRLSAAIGGPTR